MPNSYNPIKSPYNKTYNAELAYIDDLTSLYNRRYLNATLPREISKVKKEKKKLLLFMMDCDSFKDINDTYGHLNGDRVLLEIADILKKEIGKTGIPVRYAGDEFTIVLPGKELGESLKIANRLLQLASERKMELKDGKQLSNVTLSIGIAAYPDDADSAETLIDKADQALYSAKRTGKNRVSTVRDLVIEVRDRNLVINALPCKKFIDREKELEFLKKSYDSAKKGAKKFILIEGGQGLGKTRLMLELFNLNKRYPKFLLKCRRENLDQPYGAISEAINGLLDLLKASEVLSVIASLSDINKYALVSTVDKIKDLPIRYSEGKTPSMKELREEDIFSAFTNFIKELKLKIMPFLVDDILWIDRGSLKVIKWILEDTFATGALVIGTLTKGKLKTQIAQQTPFADFLKDEKIREILETIDLEPLSEQDVAEFLKAVFSGPLLPSDVERKISGLSWGFPSNIEQIIRNLVDTKIVYPKEGRWIVDEKCLNKIPASLKELLDRRISGLDDESREVLSKAAILGNDFDVSLLRFVYGKNEGELLDTLDKLRDKGILQQSLLPGETTLSFVNNIIKERIYNAIEKKQLQQLHRKVATLLENYHRLAINRVYGELRHHWKQAGETDKLKLLRAKYELPPYVTAGIIEEVEPTIEEIIEAPLSEKSMKVAPAVVSCLRAAWINSQLYPPDNKTRLDSIENLNRCIKSVLDNDPTLTVMASGEDVILNGRLLAKRKINIMLSRGLASLFSDYDINSITFKRGLSKKELDKLFSFLSKKKDYIEGAGGFAKLLKENNIINIKIDEVRYRKVSDLAIRSKRAGELFKKMMPISPAISNLFSVSDEGLVINKEILLDSKKAIDSMSDAITAISKQDISEENKSFMILEGLYKTVGELGKKEITGWDESGRRLAELFLSLGPPLRTKIIKESVGYGRDVGDFIIDILSGLDKKQITEMLHEGWFKAGMSPEELDEFLEVILRSQFVKDLSYKDVQNLFREAGIEKEAATKALDDVFTKSFFDKVAKELTESEKSVALEKKSIDNLRPLTEALIIKGDIKTVEKLLNSLLAKIKSSLPSVRISAYKGIARVSEVLLEKEVFDVSATIGTELSNSLRTEENINVYIELVNDLEMIVNTLIQKQNLSLLVSPLTAIEEEISLTNRLPDFRKCVEKTVNRIISPENMELLLFSFRKKAEKEYSVIIDLMAKFGEKVLGPLMELLFRKDEAKLDPFDIYMKKHHIALIMEKIGEKAVPHLTQSLNDKRPFVVKNIIEVLGWINDKRYLPYLEQVTNHPDKEVRKEALNVVKKLKGS